MLVAAAFLALGLVFGFVSLALGPLGLLEALIVLGLVLVQVRRFPERVGAYLIGMSVVPLIVLVSIVTRMPLCPSGQPSRGGPACYALITLPAIAGYVLAGLAGAVVTGIGLRRLFAPQP